MLEGGEDPAERGFGRSGELLLRDVAAELHELQGGPSVVTERVEQCLVHGSPSGGVPRSLSTGSGR